MSRCRFPPRELMPLGNAGSRVAVRTGLMLATVLVSLLQPLSAGTLTPNPANGVSPATTDYMGFRWTVSLIPNPALYMTSCPWLLPAAQAAAQPYNTHPDQEQWNFSYADTFNGTFTLNTFVATAGGGFGGADFKITYTPGAGDPSGNDVRWVSVIDTNNPTPRGTAYGVAGTGGNGIPSGTTAYLDNEGAEGTGARPATGWPPTDPWYGWLTVSPGGNITGSAAATSTVFIDTPSLPLLNGRVWEAQTFLAKETQSENEGVIIHNVTFYGGVWWGFMHSAVPLPEPSTLSLLAIATVSMTIQTIRRRRLQTNAPIDSRA